MNVRRRALLGQTKEDPPNPASKSHEVSSFPLVWLSSGSCILQRYRIINSWTSRHHGDRHIHLHEIIWFQALFNPSVLLLATNTSCGSCCIPQVRGALRKVPPRPVACSESPAKQVPLGLWDRAKVFSLSTSSLYILHNCAAFCRIVWKDRKVSQVLWSCMHSYLKDIQELHINIKIYQLLTISPKIGLTLYVVLVLKYQIKGYKSHASMRT